MSGLGWAAEAAPAGGMDAVQKLIEQRMSMARDAEQVRSNMAREKQAADALAENTAYRHDTFGAQQATRDAGIVDKQADAFSADTPVGPADQAKWQKAGMGGLLRTRPLDATAPTGAASVPSLTGGMSTTGGVTAPVPGGPAVTGQLQAPAQPADTPVPGRPGDMLSIPTEKNRLTQAGIDERAQASQDAIAGRTEAEAQRQLDRESLARLTAGMRPSPQPQMFVNPKDGTTHAVMFQNGKAVEIPLPDKGLQKAAGSGTNRPLPYQAAENLRAMNVADVEGTKVLKALHASGLDQSNDPADPRWTNFVATTLKIAPADYNRADVLQRTSFVQAALTRTLMGGRPSQYIAEMISKHMPQGTMSGQQLAHVMSNVLEQTAESRKESANLSGKPLQSLLPVSGQHYQQYLDELSGTGGDAGGGGDDWIDIGGVKARRKKGAQP